MKTTPVDAFPSGATPSGIFDMSGNAHEWTGDWYWWEYDPNDITNPLGPQKGGYKVLRGGSGFGWFEVILEAASRHIEGESEMDDRDDYFGFRIAENWG